MVVISRINSGIFVVMDFWEYGNMIRPLIGNNALKLILERLKGIIIYITIKFMLVLVYDYTVYAVLVIVGIIVWLLDILIRLVGI